MEENKNIKIEEKPNNEEVLEETLKEAIDEDFMDIDKESMKKNYIIIAILYLFVLILSILLFLGIKNQKATVKDKIDNKEETVGKVDENINGQNSLENNVIYKIVMKIFETIY